MRMAGDALLEEGQTRKDLTKEQRDQTRTEAGVTHLGREGSQFYDKEGSLQDIGEGSNPFKVDSLEDFDLSAYGVGAAKGNDKLNRNDVTRLMKEGGFKLEDIQEQFKDANIGAGAARIFEKRGGGSGGGGGGGDDSGDTNNPGIPDDDQDPIVGTPTPAPTPDPGPITGGGGMNQQVTQDNDINTSITGDGNTVTNNQDNSVSQMGGTSNYKDRLAYGMKDAYVLNLLNR